MEKAIKAVLTEHKGGACKGIPLSRTGLIFYVWSDGLVKPTFDEVFTSLKGSEGDNDELKMFYEKNVYLATRDVLEDWIIPSLIDVPRVIDCVSK